jgi:hypothetical protein
MIKKFLSVIQRKCSLLCAQVPANEHYPEPIAIIQPHKYSFYKVHFILSSHLSKYLSSDLFPSHCFNYSMRATCSANLILLDPDIFHSM